MVGVWSRDSRRGKKAGVKTPANESKRSVVGVGRGGGAPFSEIEVSLSSFIGVVVTGDKVVDKVAGVDEDREELRTKLKGVVGGDPKVDVRGVVSPAIVSLSSDKVGLLNGAGLRIFSPGL